MSIIREEYHAHHLPHHHHHHCHSMPPEYFELSDSIQSLTDELRLLQRARVDYIARKEYEIARIEELRAVQRSLGRRSSEEAQSIRLRLTEHGNRRREADSHLINIKQDMIKVERELRRAERALIAYREEVGRPRYVEYVDHHHPAAIGYREPATVVETERRLSSISPHRHHHHHTTIDTTKKEVIETSPHHHETILQEHDHDLITSSSNSSSASSLLSRPSRHHHHHHRAPLALESGGAVYERERRASLGVGGGDVVGSVMGRDIRAEPKLGRRKSVLLQTRRRGVRDDSPDYVVAKGRRSLDDGGRRVIYA
ncbi:hypothetical protein K402DRAFT_467965 [Aulographum hederae CBS 113979]|uniref:Uncharacterized protein n=1 Tax=Aulographum hederae CBS 113979 TaxID=1176131 RepID=A0A6G1GIY2_9PEZI|nr:hypothetical protein K402DRAFT_467965 [Aulographum hederae CBS 113979]